MDDTAIARLMAAITQKPDATAATGQKPTGKNAIEKFLDWRKQNQQETMAAFDPKNLGTDRGNNAMLNLLMGATTAPENVSGSAMERLMERLRNPKGPSDLPITTGMTETLVHGTSPQNAEKILASGKIDPSNGTRHYADLDFHRDAAYAGRPGKTMWTDRDIADESRAIPYDEFLGLQLPEDARVMRLNTADDAERFAEKFGARPTDYSPAAQQVFKIFADEVTPHFGRNGFVPPNDQAANALDKLIRGWGLDALDIAPEAASHMGTGPQVVLLRPSKARVIGRVDPTTGLPKTP